MLPYPICCLYHCRIPHPFRLIESAVWFHSITSTLIPLISGSHTLHLIPQNFSSRQVGKFLDVVKRYWRSERKLDPHQTCWNLFSKKTSQGSGLTRRSKIDGFSAVDNRFSRDITIPWGWYPRSRDQPCKSTWDHKSKHRTLDRPTNENIRTILLLAQYLEFWCQQRKSR